MGYIEQTIAPDEHVVYRTHLSREVVKGYVFLCTALPVIGGFILGVSGATEFAGTASATIAIGVICFALSSLIGKLAMDSSEFAVTSRRVLIKSGIVNQRMVEIMLCKIESIEVKQTLLEGRQKIGTIIINGTGTTKELFSCIENPLDFRKHVQQQIEENKQQAA